MVSISLISVLGAAYFASFLATRLLIPVLERRVVDTPNHRSSHTRPTPRGGGLGLMAGIVLGWAMVLFAAIGPGMGDGAETSRPLLWLLALVAGIGLAAVSFLDDLKPRSARFRLAAQALAVLAGLIGMQLFGGPQSGGAFAALLPLWLDLPLTALLWLWFINLYNFMDGIDGLAGSETAMVAGGLVLLAWAGIGGPEIAGLATPIAAAALGFLVWNWHPAKVFMGDVGSVPLGFLLGFLLIELARGGGATGDVVPLAAALCLPMYHVLDASVTLARRLLRGEKPTEAHREHVYQRAVIAGRSHAAVCGFVIVTDLALVALAVWLAPAVPVLAVLLAVLLVLLCFRALRPAPIQAPAHMPSRTPDAEPEPDATTASASKESE